MITIIDYGMGNLRSVQKAIEFLGKQSTISSSPEDLEKADKLILPGVGAFTQAMNNLKKLNLIDSLKKSVKNAKPFLGICLGMQLLLETSEEHGISPGLGLVNGSVCFFRNNKNFDQKLAVPHMGWNYIKQNKKNKLLAKLPEKFQTYFVHSYYVQPADPTTVIGSTNYSIDFCSVLQQKNIFGVQFHPEKSGENGLQIIKNFLEL